MNNEIKLTDEEVYIIKNCELLEFDTRKKILKNQEIIERLRKSLEACYKQIEIEKKPPEQNKGFIYDLAHSISHMEYLKTGAPNHLRKAELLS